MTQTALIATLLDEARRHDDFGSDIERLQRFGELLRRYRSAIPVHTKTLGNFVRLPNKIGKPVSQEELAEAIGVTRCWYGMLEVGRPVRPSIALIERICDVLMLDEPKRVQLVELGLPGLSQSLSKTILGGSCTAA